ncbi:MAG: dephospho-CoA kinase [Candidatus Nanosalina sp. J07AB43]|nr:MAG: dephospho-CoA kinase [Candidatus Nanosalina sp. J07AB43]
MTEIYGVTGMPLSGKTLVADIMKDQGFKVLDMGDVVRIEMQKRDIETEDTGNWVNDMREEHGMDAIAKLSLPYLQEIVEENQDVVITGMRGWSEKNRFEEEINQDISVVSVWASKETRKSRRNDRQREEDVKGDEFHERDIREIENGVGKLMALSNHIVKNDNKSKQELEEKVKTVLES